MVFCQHAGRKIKIYDYENRESKTACVNYGFLTYIFEITNNAGIDTCIVLEIDGFSMQKHDDQHKLWAHELHILWRAAYKSAGAPKVAPFVVCRRSSG